jgi:Piwi domain
MSTWQPRPTAPGPCSGPPLLAINFLPVTYTADKFPADMTRYESREQFTRLKAELAATHVVIRTGDQVACVPISPDASAVGKATELDIREHRRVAARLVEAALVRSVLAPRYKLRRLVPPAFVQRGRDLMREAAQDLGIELAGVNVHPQYSLDSRATGPAEGPGIVVGIKTRYEISLPVSELLRSGFPVLGRYVLVAPDDLDPLLDPVAARRVAGAIEAVTAGQLALKDAPRDHKVPSTEAWLEGRREVMHDVVHALAGPVAGGLLSRLEKAAFSVVGAEGRLAKTRELADWFGRSQLELAVGLAATVGAPVGTSGPTRTKLKSLRLAEPAFVFNPGGDKTHKNATRGLAEYGPFDSESFTPKRPSIAVVTPAAFKGTAETFMQSFLNGVPRTDVFAKGFIRKYHLGACDVTFEAFDSGTGDVAAYKAACLAALGRPKKPDLAFVITSQEQEELSGDDSPYLVCKSTFMSQGVPVQDVQIETIRRGDLAYPLDSIALACYAKLGGTPYVIAAPRAMTQELVIGIGSAHVKQTRLTAPERVVGITTVFSADGNYLLSNQSREVDYVDYPAELLRSLESCINHVRDRNGWQPEDALRLIFHVFKPLKDTEAQAVKRLVAKLAGEFAKVEFAFLHLSNEHDWGLFDQNSDGHRGRGRRVPERGHAVQVSRSEMLISVTGPRDMKLPLQGLPRPLMLKLHRESTFSDLEYLAGQVFRFTYMSWRRPYPSRTPVTILYSELIAELLGHLRHVRNWNADIVSSPELRDSRWFL